MQFSTAKELRKVIRSGEWQKSTSGVITGYVQANLVILPMSLAFDFLLFCHRNPKPCPLLEATDPGDPMLRMTAPGADIRTDLPKYRIFEEGKLVKEVTDIRNFWKDDFMAFLLGCSYTFDELLLNAGIPLRHYERNEEPAVYITNIPCEKAGIFSGPLVVSMRSIPFQLVVRAVQITGRFPKAHGAPIHIGSPDRIGVKDLKAVDFGVVPEVRQDEVPVFWACGVTPQAVAIQSKVPFMITHVPGHMFVTDWPLDELSYH